MMLAFVLYNYGVLATPRLYCGFDDAIEIFDIQQPGEGERLPTTPSKKSKDGLKGKIAGLVTWMNSYQISGIISSIAFSSSYDYYAIGSLTPSSRSMDNIALYSESNKAAIMPIGSADAQSGVTQACHLKKLVVMLGSFLTGEVQSDETTCPVCCISSKRCNICLGPSQRYICTCESLQSIS